METICDICESKIKNKKDIVKHKKSETCKKIEFLLKKKSECYELKINQYIQDNNLLKKQNEEKDIQLKLFQDKYEDLRKIVEKAATKSTNTVKNYTHNNYLNYISTEPLKISDFPKQLKNIVNCDTVMYDDNDFHEHIVDNILRDKSGKDKVLCTDINRKNFTYKDEKSGELISDPELEILRDQLKKGTNIRQIRKDLLDKLVTEYEDNGSIGIDPYKRFSDIIQKLNFGSPFVDHVAKKTYIKSKSNNKLEEYDEEEYKKLDELEE
jgi:hypothetical protein